MLEIDLKNTEKAPDDWSEVFDYKEDILKLKSELESQKAKYQNVLVVGNGGSITSFDAIVYALGKDYRARSVWTMDPAYINKIKSQFSKESTVVVAVSKSGNTLGQIESLLCFGDYDVIAVTQKGSGTLFEIAKKMGWKIIEHPPVGGRFSAGTSSTLASSYLAGANIDNIQSGLVDGYISLKDKAFSLAKFYFDLEKEGYGEVYVSLYTEALSRFQNLIIQLMHESVCKDGQGQTLYAAMAPESQHHTNQRFLGGKGNVIGTFINVSDPETDIKLNIPEQIREIEYKGTKLKQFELLSLNFALNAEYVGTKRDADKNNIPNVTITIDRISEESVGQFIAFWHLVAFYSSILRGVNPFDQPAVENSKDITLGIIKEKL